MTSVRCRFSENLSIRRNKRDHRGCGHSVLGADQLGNNDMLPALLPAIHSALENTEPKAHVLARQEFHSDDAGEVGIWNRNRFHKRNVRHSVPPMFLPAKRTYSGEFGQLANQILATACVTRSLSLFRLDRGFQTVNAGVAA